MKLSSRHVEHRSPHAETVLRTRNTSDTNLRMRKWSSARETRISACRDVPPHAENMLSACGDVPPHAKHESPHAETFFHTRNTGLGMRRRFSACGSTRRAEDNEKSAVLGFRKIDTTITNCTIILLFPTKAIAFSLETPLYNISENNTLSICVDLVEGELAREVIFNLTYLQITTEGIHMHTELK